MRTPIFAGFVGVGGETVWLDTGIQYEDDAPVVLARPDLFNEVPETDRGGVMQPRDETAETDEVPVPVKRGPGRPRKNTTDKPNAVD